MTMNLKEDLLYFLSLFIEYSLQPRAFIWARIIGKPTYTYYYFQNRMKERSKLEIRNLSEKILTFDKFIKEMQRRWKTRWQGQWSMVIFDIPEKQRQFRNQFRKKLIEIGYAQLQKSIFISPFNRIDKIKHYFELEAVKDRVLCLELKKIHGFKTEELVNFCWNTVAIEKAYQAFLSDFEGRLQRFKNLKGNFKEKEEQTAAQWLILSLRENLTILLEKFPPLPRDLMPKDTLLPNLFHQTRFWLKQLKTIMGNNSSPD